MAKTPIEWTDYTWNPITGCSIVSPGCRRCYAMKLAGTRLRNHPSRAGLTRDTESGPVWTGEVRFNEKWLHEPLVWKRPRMIFVCAHADLFHENVPDEWIDKVFAVMAMAEHHTFQVLTKRAERMREYCLRLSFRTMPFLSMMDSGSLPNVWLGTSVERQKEADERIPFLLQTPAAIRFISAEPLLGPINLDRIHEGYNTPEGARVDMWESCLSGKRYDMWAGDDEDPMQPGHPKLDWVIVGGESAYDAKPMHPDWARSLRDQCAAAGTPFLFKQWGSFCPQSDDGKPEAYWASQPAVFSDHAVHQGYCFGRNPKQRPWMMHQASKKVTGRLLDGIEHNGMPKRLEVFL